MPDHDLGDDEIKALIAYRATFPDGATPSWQLRMRQSLAVRKRHG